MKSIKVFYQFEGVPGVDHLDVPADSTLADVRRAIAQKRGSDPKAPLFLENADEPADTETRAGDHAQSGGLKVHVHRCRRIEVTVTFNGRPETRAFAPGATIARIKKWAAEDVFGMTPAEAGEHVLQLPSLDRPSPGTHIGTLASHPECCVKLDLVPSERVNG